MELLEQELTEQVIGACLEVSNVLGSGFVESVYHCALVQELSLRGIEVRSQCAMEVTYKGAPVGDFIADVIVGNRLILELKALPVLTPVHEAQLLNYLKGIGLKVGLLVSFGTPKVQWKRMVF